MKDDVTPSGHGPSAIGSADVGKDAALMAAAPELYEALLSAKRLCDNINEFGHVTDQEFHDAADTKIRAVLSSLQREALAEAPSSAGTEGAGRCSSHQSCGMGHKARAIRSEGA